LRVGFFYARTVCALRVFFRLKESSKMENTIVKLPGVIAATGKGRSAIYADVKQGTFPAPIKLGARSVGWTTESLDLWIAGRIAASKVAI